MSSYIDPITSRLTSCLHSDPSKKVEQSHVVRKCYLARQRVFDYIRAEQLVTTGSC